MTLILQKKKKVLVGCATKMDAKQVTVASTSSKEINIIDRDFDTKSFINDIKARPSIWDSSEEEFSNRVLKNKAWFELVEKYGSNSSKYKRIELGQLKKKWKNLRACYIRELKRRSGSKSYPRKSQYIYFERLRFLDNVVSPKELGAQESDEYLPSDDYSEGFKIENCTIQNQDADSCKTEDFEVFTKTKHLEGNTMETPNYFEKNYCETESFISEIESLPALWDPSTLDYSNRVVKNKCWNFLIDKYGSHLSVIEKRELGSQMKKKWHNLRACYARELKRKSGIGCDHRKSEYIFFTNLHFLEHIVNPKDIGESVEETEGEFKNKSTHLDEESSDEYEECKGQKKIQRSSNIKQETKRNIIEDEDSTEDTEYESKKKKITRIKNEFEEDVESIKDSKRSKIRQNKVKRRVNKPENDSETIPDDEDRFFLLSLLKPLRSVPQSKKMALKIKFMTLLDEATHENVEDK